MLSLGTRGHRRNQHSPTTSLDASTNAGTVIATAWQYFASNPSKN
jgi:hypothetical protein